MQYDTCWESMSKERKCHFLNRFLHGAKSQIKPDSNSRYESPLDLFDKTDCKVISNQVASVAFSPHEQQTEKPKRRARNE